MKWKRNLSRLFLVTLFLTACGETRDPPRFSPPQETPSRAKPDDSSRSPKEKPQTQPAGAGTQAPSDSASVPPEREATVTIKPTLRNPVQTQPQDASWVIKNMGVGFNLGNTFDLKVNTMAFGEVKAIIDLYAQAGYRHIRIPITWMDGFDGDHLAAPGGQIRTDHPRLKLIVQAIDYALSKSLYVIINTHHEFWLKHHYRGEQNMEERFARLWTGIAQYFAAYPPQLMFEVLNEPEGTFGDFSGSVSPFDPTAINLTRRINEIGYRAIREADPRNKQRIVLIMPNAQGNQSLLDEVYPNREALPMQGRDPFLAVSVHTYDPWGFCGQEGNNGNWPGEESIVRGIRDTARHARTLGVAVHYGEFGVGRRDQQAERAAEVVKQYYRITSATILSEGMAPTVWDDRGWFGLVQRQANGQFGFTHDLAKVLVP